MKNWLFQLFEMSFCLTDIQGMLFPEEVGEGSGPDWRPQSLNKIKLGDCQRYKALGLAIILEKKKYIN